ncbi:hypothetical protein [Brevibacillus sp. SYSU BS000544]|uniref:hypothetical protein n=1 Tax=Brevibacillus sp. SYSU BS000544 TaxID=3416443 RepID=UPI003CE44D65
MKYSCKHCCNIIHNDLECPICGKNEIIPIIITISVQPESTSIQWKAAIQTRV